MTHQEIINLINTYIKSNGQGDITGSRLNTVLNALADYYGFDSVVVTTLPAGSDATVDVQGRVLQLGIPRGMDGSDAVNPFKGWFNSLDDLKSQFTAAVGDSAYVKDPSPATTWSIYVYDETATTDNYWADSGIDADTSNVQTFASGEEVNEVHIVSDLTNEVETDVLSAKQGNELLKRVSDIKEVPFPPKNPYVIGTIYNTWYGFGTSEHYEIPVVPGSEYVIKSNSSLESVFCVLRSVPNTYLASVEGTSADYATGWSSQVILPASKEMLIRIPADGHVLCVWSHLRDTGERTPASVKRVISYNDSLLIDKKSLLDDIVTSKIHDYGIGANGKWVGGSDYYYYFRGVCVPINESVKSLIVETSLRGSMIAFLSDFDESDVVIGNNVTTLLANHTFYENKTLNVPNGTKYVWVNVYSIYEMPPFFYPQKIECVVGNYNGVVPNKINYFTVKINSKQLGKNWASSVMQDDTITNDVGAAIIFPSSYLPTGKPTPIVATLHGANGWVTADNFGQHNSQNWNRYINNLLNNGYAVFDVNGYGVGEFDVTTNIAPSSWGCPRAVEAMKKAFDYIVENYNVERQMYIHGLSAGGCLGYAFTMNYPDCVKAVSMFEPSQPTNNVKENHQSSDAERWYDIVAIAYGYANWAAAIADNFDNFVGYSLPLSFMRLNNGNLETIGNLPLSEELVNGLFGSFPRPIRIYQGSQQTGMVSISEELNQNIVNALNNGGCNASIRLAPGATHGDFVGSSAIDYIIDEELLFFKRF